MPLFVTPETTYAWLPNLNWKPSGRGSSISPWRIGPRVATSVTLVGIPGAASAPATGQPLVLLLQPTIDMRNHRVTQPIFVLYLPISYLIHPPSYAPEHILQGSVQ